MRHIPLTAFAILPLTLAACSPETSEEAEQTAEEEQRAEAEQQMQEATLDLQADGIILPAQGGFEQYAAPFGSTRAATETTLAAVLGEVVERGENQECGAGPMQMSTYEGMVLNFQDDTFVGYFAREPYVPELTRAEMLADPMVTRVVDSTLGEEFTIGNPEGDVISGLFDGAEDDSAIEALWAGTNCLFR